MSRYGTYDLKHGFIPDDDCPQQETPKQNNADRIRAMTDEELAVWLEEFGGSSPNCNRGLSEYPDYKRCRDCWLDWLKQEVDE